MVLLIISDTAILKKNGSSIVLEPPLREIEALSHNFSKIIWLGISASEGFPKVIAEAMSYGCVPVATALTGIKDLIKHKDTGWLLDEKDTLNNLNDSLKNLINNKELLSWISKNAIKDSSIFTYDKFNKVIENFIH